ncbi:hypothetical protein I8H83_05380 [Candidatus Saccharibacteria bacterium]|nr:hypothetical protein [Candidatus Saccharibacteria bacterium]
MRLFRAVRLTLWTILLGGCIATGVLYLSIDKSTDAAHLESIARQANTYDIVRDNLLTPKILAEAQGAGYGSLIDKQVVSQAVAVSFDDTALEQLLNPATQSLANWLGSRQPDATFSIDASKQFARLTSLLADKISTKMMTAPNCTYFNSLADVTHGVCKIPGIAQEELRTGIVAILNTQPMIKEGTITSEQLEIPSTLLTQTSNIPQYLSMLYAAAIFAAGLGVLIVIWLLLRHRLIGVATIGIAGLIAYALLLGSQLSFMNAINSYVLEPGYQEIVRALAQVISDEMRSTALYIGAVSLAITLIGAGGWWLLRRHRKQSEHAVHLHESNSN